MEAILDSIAQPGRRPALIGGRILPKWEAPLPAWWPRSLRGVLSIIEHEGNGEYRTAAVPENLEPYAANMVVHVLSLLAAGGFGTAIGRYGDALLSDEEVQLAWTLQDAGYSVRYNSRIVVHHQIQARRLDPAWLLSRLYWQGASTVLTRRLLRRPETVWKELPRRMLVAALFAPAALVPRHSTRVSGRPLEAGLRRRVHPRRAGLARDGGGGPPDGNPGRRVILYRWRGETHQFRR